MSAILWQRIEGAVVFGLAAVAAVVLDLPGLLGGSLVLCAVVALAPDVSFLAYLAGPRFGAACYNLVHLYAWGMVLVVLGFGLAAAPLLGIGLLWTAHVGLDRALGYGLKEPTGFADTHLGRVGRR